VPLTINLCNVQQFKPTSLVHGGGQQELESLLVFGRLDVQELSEGLEIMSLIRNYSELGKTYLL
jgi:hypothetical protein